MKRPHQKDRQRREAFAVFLRAQVGRDRHLADIEFMPADHAAERVDEDGDVDEIELEGLRRNRAVLERLIVALGASDRRELHLRNRTSSSRIEGKPLRLRISIA